MATMSDLMQAKQSVSGRLLQAGLRGRAIGAIPVLNVAAAVDRAGSHVHAVGIGHKLVGGSETPELCIRIHVVQKLPASLLKRRDILPSEIEGMPTDVIESPPAMALAKQPKCSVDRRKRQRPVIGGISAGHFTITAGTLSCMCRSTRTVDDPTKVYALSNNHVFADVNKGRVGDALYQPGALDGGTADDQFAKLHRYVKIELGGKTPNIVDCAIGELLPEMKYKAEICTVGKVQGIERAELDMIVRKHGRTTGYTEGKVTDVAYDALVGMDHSDPNVVALFEDQVRLERIGAFHAIGLGGDSGSLVLMKDKTKAVGLYFAGPSSGIYGIANHIDDVLKGLEIQLL